MFKGGVEGEMVGDELIFEGGEKLGRMRFEGVLRLLVLGGDCVEGDSEDGEDGGSGFWFFLGDF